MRLPYFCVCIIVFVTGLSSLRAQTTAEADADLKRQVSALRDAVIQQTRQIDALTAEIERLGIAMGQRRAAKAPTAIPTPAEIAPAGESSVVSANPPAPTPVIAATPTPDPSILQHTVVKGDNLTNIAKKYGTTVDAIQKLNKITDARKMQVGQIISVPTPAASPAPSATPAPAKP